MDSVHFRWLLWHETGRGEESKTAEKWEANRNKRRTEKWGNNQTGLSERSKLAEFRPETKRPYTHFPGRIRQKYDGTERKSVFPSQIIWIWRQTGGWREKKPFYVVNKSIRLIRANNICSALVCAMFLIEFQRRSAAIRCTFWRGSAQPELKRRAHSDWPPLSCPSSLSRTRLMLCRIEFKLNKLKLKI